MIDDSRLEDSRIHYPPARPYVEEAVVEVLPIHWTETCAEAGRHNLSLGCDDVPREMKCVLTKTDGRHLVCSCGNVWREGRR